MFGKKKQLVRFQTLFIRILRYYDSKAAGSLEKILCKPRMSDAAASCSYRNKRGCGLLSRLIAAVCILRPLLTRATLPKRTYSPINLFSYSLTKQAAFTLAEVLITLGIIGVVAAMTMPVLIQNHREKVTVTRLKKVYSTLSQALVAAINENGTPDLWDSYQYEDKEESEDAITRFSVKNLAKQLKTVKDCGYESKGCFVPDGYKNLSGSKERDFENLNNRYYKLVLEDGTLVAIEGYGVTPGDDNKTYGEIWVDINGKAAPNISGKDLFLFLYKKYKVVPYGYDKTDKSLKSLGCTPKGNGGASCTAWILINENMDYLHCDDLSWNGKTRCK